MYSCSSMYVLSDRLRKGKTLLQMKMLLMSLMRRMKVKMNFMTVYCVTKKCLLSVTLIMRMMRTVQMMKYWKKMSNQGTESGQSCWFIFSFLVLWKVYQNTVSIQAKGLEGWQSPPHVGKFSKISSFR